MGLKEYKTKRDFRRTPEPEGGKSGRSGHRFVIQKHDASRLHYDFRLQVDDVLASWAVPKGPSLDPSHKRLAVHVEDHPLEYADFEGIIPQGQYGGGTVMVWDKGTYEPEGDAAAGIKRGKLSFSLAGEKLHGAWTLTRLHGSRGGDARDNWLLIKQDDEAASRAGADITERAPDSVKSGRSIEQIAADEDATWESGRESRTGSSAKKSAAQKKAAGNGRVSKKRSRSNAAKPTAPDPSKASDAKKAAIFRSPSPQLCTLTDRAPSGEDWIHEIKFDGYRFLAKKTKSGVTLITRGDKDWTSKFKPIAEEIEKLPCESAIIDGEACIIDRHGMTSFQRLQQAIKEKKFDALVFFVFDLLYLDGYDLTRTPLIERKELLHQLVPRVNEGRLRFSDHVRGGGKAVYENACELAVEGIISKRVDAAYTQSRSKSWLKVKCSRRQEFVIVGWSPPSGSRKHFGSLLLGAYDGDGKLMYSGKVGTGFNEATLKDVKKRLDALSRKTTPLDEGGETAETRGAHWVRPELVAEIEFTEITDDGRLRHPSFQGLRFDKEAAKVKLETPEPVEQAAEEAAGAGSASARSKRSGRRGSGASSKSTSSAKATAKTSSRRTQKEKGDAEVAGVRVSSPDRVLYPESQLTKLELARYISEVAERMLPFVSGRPLSTVRCPQGRAKECFFQKHMRETFSEPVKSISVKEKDGTRDYIAVDSVEGLVTLVQFGVLEIHPWGATERDLEHPDVLTFDLDPGEGAELEQVKDGAVRVRDLLESLGLTSYLKATGGKGLHVVVPLKPSADWDEAKAFCRGLAERVAKEDPKHFIATASKAKRRGKVYVDYLRNARGATSIAPFSMRARVGAPVAVPLRWDELAGLESSAQYTVENVLQRLAQLNDDPWPKYRSTRQQLTRSRLEAVL